MKKYISLVLIIAIIAIYIPPVSAQITNNLERIQGWSQDIDTLMSLIKREHYIYRTQPLPEIMIKKSIELKKYIAQYSDERMLGELEKLNFYVHDGHSYILPLSEKVLAYYMPLQFYIFKDGVYIIDAEDPYNYLIGAQVISINGIAVNKLIRDMNGYIHQDNQFTVKWFAPSILRFRGVYESYGLTAGSKNISVEVQERSKTSKSIIKLNFIPASQFHGIPKLQPSHLKNHNTVPLYLSNVSDNFWFKSLYEKRVLYFQFNQVENKENETLASFSKTLDDTLKQNEPQLLLIDVRHNNGGNLNLLDPLVTVIKNFEKNNPKSKIIVITGRNTFSAAQVFISLINKETHAEFAGEPSSSKPNFVGEGNYIRLPWSAAMGSISNKYHETIPGDKRKWIEPTYTILLSSRQYFNNEDPVLDFILHRFNQLNNTLSRFK
ncbi:MAG TPA: hypothetical protein VFQ58_07680 [Flavisolibacter sp.]|nr:hypothetical protein [Flavisolibacter sp.]